MLAYSISNRNSFIGILAAKTRVLIVVYFRIKLKYKFVSVNVMARHDSHENITALIKLYIFIVLGPGFRNSPQNIIIFVI